MLALLRKDLYLFEWLDYILIPVLVLILSFVLPFDFSFLIFALTSVAPLFFHDQKKSINHFNVSLPISKALIVRARYLFVFILVTLFLTFQLLLHVLINPENTPDSWQNIGVLLSLSILLLSIGLPCYYYFKSFFIAIAFQWVFSIIVMSFYMPVSDHVMYFHFLPSFREWLDINFGSLSLLFFPLLAFGLYYLSMKLSTFLMSRKVR